MGPVREQDTEGEHGAEQCQLPQPLRAVTALTALALQVTRGIAHSGAAPVAPKVPKSGSPLSLSTWRGAQDGKQLALPL